MEKEENKLTYEDLVDLMGKIEIEVNKSKERQESIDHMTEELYEEVRPMMVEKRKTEIEEAKKDKSEFDEMTKNALVKAKKQLLQIREQSEKGYQDSLVKTAKKQSDIKRKLSSIKKDLVDKDQLDKIATAEEKANNALEKVNNEMKEFQDKHFELRKQLEGQEKIIWDYAVELGVEAEIDSVSFEEKKPEETKTEEKKLEEKKTEEKKSEEKKPEETKTEEKKSEEKKPEETKTEEKKTEDKKPEETKTEETKTKTTNPRIIYPKKPSTKTNTANTKTTTQNKDLKWHEKLTPEQIQEAISREIYRPEGQEYEQFLKEQGIKDDIKKEKIEVTSIEIDPFESSIIYSFNNNLKRQNNWKGETKVSFDYNKEQIQNNINVLKNMSNRDDIDSLSKAIDPNILKWLAENSKNFDMQINDYLDILSGKKTDVKLVYNLKDIYNSDLDSKQIRNITKIAKTAERLSGGTIEVEKDSLLKRLYGNIKKRIEETSRKLLPAKEEKELDVEEVKEEIHTSTDDSKDKNEDGKINLMNYASTAYKKVGRFFGNVRRDIAIAGTKVIGKAKGENKLVTDSKVRKISQGFVPKAKVDEKAAIEKVESSKENSKAIDKDENPIK